MLSYKIPQSILLQTVASESVLLETSSGTYFTLDEVGSRMLALYQACGSVRQTAVQMAKEFAVSEQTAHNDLCELLETMQKNGLVELVQEH